MSEQYAVITAAICWKQHECVDCMCVYRYQLRRLIQGAGTSERTAHESASQAASIALSSEVDVRPCPTCGRVQPDMIGQTRAALHLWVVRGLLAVFALDSLIGAFTMAYGDAAWVAATAALVGTCAHLLIALPDPNADRERNKARANQLIGDGISQVIRPGRDISVPATTPKTMTVRHWVGVIAGALGAIVLAGPVIAKTAGGWPVNPKYDPVVFGPGDTFRVRFTESVEAVGGRWKGQPEVTVLNPGEIGNVSVSATGSDDSWSDEIVGDGVRDRMIHPYADIKVPDDDRLAGKTLQLQVRMTVDYPRPTRQGFVSGYEMVIQQYDVKIASRGAGSIYRRTFWLGVVVGGLLSVASGLYLRGLAKQLCKQANPSEVQWIGDTQSLPPADNGHAERSVGLAVPGGQDRP